MEAKETLWIFQTISAAPKATATRESLEPIRPSDQLAEIIIKVCGCNEPERHEHMETMN